MDPVAALRAIESGADPVQDFLNGKTGLLWTGSWAVPNARKKFGDDLPLDTVWGVGYVFVPDGGG